MPMNEREFGNNQPLSIGLFSPAWPPAGRANGVLSYVDTLSRSLESLGHRVTILCSNVSDGDRDPRVFRLASVSRRGPARRLSDWAWYRWAPQIWKECRFDPEIGRAVARSVQERGIQVIEMEESFGWAEMVRQWSRIPVSVRLHGPWFMNGTALGVPNNRVYRKRVALEGEAIRRAVGVTAPSYDVLERTRTYYGLGLDQARVIPNPTPHVPPRNRWRSEDRDPGRIVFIGRFDRHKGGDLIVEAFARILRTFPEARLDFAGPDHNVIDDEGKRWDLTSFVDARIPGAREDGRVRLLGRVPYEDLPALRRQASVTVVCSRYETFGLTVSEAAVMGCPIVAARVGGISEILRDGVDGLLHQPGNAVDLADRILELLSDPGRAAELGASAAAHCEREFDPIAIATRLAEHYQQLLNPMVRTGSVVRSAT